MKTLLTTAVITAALLTLTGCVTEDFGHHRSGRYDRHDSHDTRSRDRHYSSYRHHDDTHRSHHDRPDVTVRF